MIIHFSPQRSDEQLAIDMVSNGLIINGELYDMSEVTTEVEPVGFILAGGQSEVTIRLPIPANAPPEVSFPQPVSAITGPVLVPGHSRQIDGQGQVLAQEVKRNPSTTVPSTGTDAAGNTTEVIEETLGTEKILVVKNKPVPVQVAPKVVTMRQARLALLGAGKLQMVEAAIDALPEPPKTAAKIEWEYSQEVHRDKPFVQMLAQGLGLTQTELDQLFIVAATL